MSAGKRSFCLRSATHYRGPATGSAPEKRFARATDAGRRTGDAAALASAALGFASIFLTVPGVNLQIIGRLEEALDLLAPGDSALRAMLTVRLAQELAFGDQRERMTALGQKALAMARRVGDKAALAYTLSCIMRFGAASVNSLGAGQFTALIDETIRLAHETGNKWAASEAYIYRIGVSLTLGERDAADAAIDVY